MNKPIVSDKSMETLKTMAWNHEGDQMTALLEAIAFIEAYTKEKKDGGN